MFVLVCYVPIFCQLAFWLDIVSFHVIICRSNARLSSVFPPHSRISDLVEFLRFVIWAPPTLFRADSVNLSTPHTTGTSEKIIFRTTKIIGRGEISPKSARLSCGVYPALCFWNALEVLWIRAGWYGLRRKSQIFFTKKQIYDLNRFFSPYLKSICRWQRNCSKLKAQYVRFRH